MGPTTGTTGADGRLSDAARLRRLHDTGLLDGGSYPSLDRLARTAVQQLHGTGALVSLVAADRRVLAGYAGAAPKHSFCRMVVDTDAPLLICDARTDERVLGHPAVEDGVVAYAGFPIRSPDGYPLGAFGVFDGRARDWEPRDLLFVEDIAAAVESEIALRAGARAAEATAERLRGVLHRALDACVSMDPYGVVTAWNAAAERLFGYPAGEAVGHPMADLIIPDRFASAHAAGLARLHSGGPSTLAGARVVLTARNRAGDEFPVEMTLQDARDDSVPAYHAFLHDISDRVEERRQLEHDRTFLQTLLDSVDIGVAACDADGRLTLFNLSMQAIHGTGSKPVGSAEWASAFDLYGPDGRTPLAADEIPLARAYAGERVDRQEIVVSLGGSARSFLVNGRPLTTSDGRRLGAMVAMHDVTEQRRIEKLRDLRLTVARALADADSAGEAADRTVAAVCRALDWALGEFWRGDDEAGTITRVGEWVAPGQDLAAVTLDRARTLERGAGLPGHIWATGTEVWATEVATDPRSRLRADQLRAAGLHSVIGVPVRSDDRVLGVLIFFSTVPERPDPEILDLLDGVCAHLGRHMERRRAEELALALAAARRDIERVDDYVWTVEVRPDRSVGSVYASANGTAVFGELLPLQWDMITAMRGRVHPDDNEEFQRFCRSVLEGNAAENEIRMLGADDVTRWVWTRAVPRWENGRLLVDGISTNVTDRHEIAEERERLLADQQTQNRLKDELVALVSHELRNPLGAIRSYSETLLEDPDLTAEQRHLTEVIDRRSGHMQHLVDDLLDMARLEAGQRLHIDPKPLSAVKLIRDVVGAQQPAADAKSLTVTVDVPRHLPVQADPVRLRQVMDNLLSNALKYTPAGGLVTVTARYTPADGYGDGEAVFSFADTGIGIPADQYPNLFDRFFRASNAVTMGIKGTGLGLAITRAIVEAHGGTLCAEPAPTGGTVFTVVLPAL